MERWSWDGQAALLQFAQVPVISTTVMRGTNPFARALCINCSVMLAVATSPTAPHFSQIRKATDAELS